MHCSSLYSSSLYDGKIRKGDEGGNKIPVFDIQDQQKIANLHKLYDNIFGLGVKNFEYPLS